MFFLKVRCRCATLVTMVWRSAELVYVLRSAFAARQPAAQGNGSFFSIPSTYETARAQEPPALSRRAGLLSFGPGGGWCFRWFECHGADFHSLIIDVL